MKIEKAMLLGFVGVIISTRLTAGDSVTVTFELDAAALEKRS